MGRLGTYRSDAAKLLGRARNGIYPYPKQEFWRPRSALYVSSSCLIAARCCEQGTLQASAQSSDTAGLADQFGKSSPSNQSIKNKTKIKKKKTTLPPQNLNFFLSLLLFKKNKKKKNPSCECAVCSFIHSFFFLGFDLKL